MMKKLAAALLAAAMTVSVGTVAFAAAPTVEGVQNALDKCMTLFDGDIEIIDDKAYLDGGIDYGTITPDLVIEDVIDLTGETSGDRILTDDGKGTGNYVSADVVKPGKTYYIPLSALHGFSDGMNTENPDTSKLIAKILTDKKLAKFSYDNAHVR